ncbi:hypothetical protein BJY00DRAFT_295084 [Aspergillus carlsbadensis]|nr:hypothetical protein BJY00DRAFT_295084 [Aspergillus carlsbadensis]
MAPLLNLFAARTAVPAIRASAAAPRVSLSTAASKSHSALSQRRWNSSGSDGKNVKESEEAQRAATSMPHVSEEAAEVSRIMEKEKRCDGVPSTPELQQGTMVSEVGSF